MSGHCNFGFTRSSTQCIISSELVPGPSDCLPKISLVSRTREPERSPGIDLPAPPGSFSLGTGTESGPSF